MFSASVGRVATAGLVAVLALAPSWPLTRRWP
jgi:hypothetical protein